jgi:hypothetical protein
MSFLRFLMLLSLVTWVGALIFFPVVAQTAFSVLPSRQLAGAVVGRSLGILHWIGIVSGIIFLSSSVLYSRFSTGTAHVFAAGNLLMCLMLALTLISQFSVIPRMDALRASIPGEIDSVPADIPARMQFDGLHMWSTRLEGAVLFLGLVVVYLVSRSPL